MNAVLAIALWFTVNISTLILNKYIFQILGFVYPFTLTAVHMLTCTIGSYLCIRAFKFFPWTELSYDDQIRKVIPLALLFCANIVLGNISLRWVPVSFMQTVKSTVPAFTIIIQACFLGKAFSRLTYLSLFPIVGGVVLASFTEINFDTVGFLAALIASVITALLAVVSGMLLTTTLDAINLLYYMAPTSTLVVLPFVFLNELEGILSWPYFGTFYGFLVLLISGLIAFGLNITTFLVIKHTSPLTYTVAGNFKIVLSISISVLIFRNTITILNGVGCLIAVAGVWWYNNIRQQEKLKEKLSETRKQGM